MHGRKFFYRERKNLYLEIDYLAQYLSAARQNIMAFIYSTFAQSYLLRLWIIEPPAIQLFFLFYHPADPRGIT